MGFTTKELLTPAGVKLVATLAALKSKPYVKVGVLAEAGQTPKKEHDDKKGFGFHKMVTLVEVAIWNEFGTDRIPERSFIRSTHDEQRDKWLEETDQIRKKVMQGEMTVDQGLKRMGVIIKAAIQAKMRTSVPPPNAAVTIAKKGSSVTLIDTGQLLNSMDFEVHRKGDEQ